MGWRAAKRVLIGLGPSQPRWNERGESGPTTPVDLELELAELDLSGKHFGPFEYAETLGTRLKISILFRFINPVDDPATVRRLALRGGLADARYLEHRNAVLISLPSNLSPFLLTLTAFHELAHITAGDVIEGRRIARREPADSEAAREEEADARALYLYLAGSLGARNPYAVGLYGVP